MALREPSVVRGPRPNVRGDIRNTEAGMSKPLIEAVKREEAINMPRDTERVVVFDENGKVLGANTGREGEVEVPYNVNLRNTVVTHNHPTAEGRRRYGDNLATRVGSTLSPADVGLAVSRDVKEIRATTKGGYLYSLKRPAGGWGASSREVLYQYRQYQKEYRAKFGKKQLQKIYNGESDVARFMPRFNVASQHYALKKLAAQFGWKYAYRKA